MRMPKNAQERTAMRYTPSGYTAVSRDGINGIVYTQSFPNGNGTQIYHHAIGYRGTSYKSAFHYSFRTVEQMNAYIEEFFTGIASHDQYIRENREKRKNFIPTLKPGDILDTCWGYDQTNREFFQVISVNKKTAVLREIKQKQIEGTGPFSSTVIGLKDQFCDKEITRRILEGNSVRIDECRSASLWDGKPAHCSWGA